MLFKSKKQQVGLAARRRDRAGNRTPRPTDPELAQRYTFRRNRTITGSLASSVTSAETSSAHLKSSRVHAHDLRRHRRRLAWTLTAVVSIAIGLAYLVLNFIVQPQLVAANGEALSGNVYQPILQAYFRKYPADRLAFVVDTGRLAGYMQQNGAPEIQSIDTHVKLNGIGSADFTAVLRKPAVVWRTNDIELYVDRSGTAFRRHRGASPSVEVVDKSGIRVSDNRVLASNRFLGFIGRVVGAMADGGFTVTQVEIPPGVTRQVDVSVAGVGYPIKFSVDRPAGEQAEDAARAIRHMAAQNIAPQYMDVRVSGRAYYR